MKFRRFGNTGMQVSELSLGTYLTVARKLDLQATKNLVGAALTDGVNLFDTADVYENGEGEILLGKALAAYPRSEYCLVTKCFFPTGASPLARGLSRKHIVDSVEASLKRLNRSYLDILLCHRFDPTVALEETVQAMDDLIRQGKILYWGVSRWTEAQLEAAFSLCGSLGLRRPVCQQSFYNFFDREAEVSMLEFCAQNGMAFMAYGALAQGVLTGKYRGSSFPEGSRATDPQLLPQMHNFKTEKLMIVEEMSASLERRGIRPASFALAWCLRRTEVSTVLVGASSPAQLAENIAGLEVTSDTFAAMERIMSAKG